MDNLAKRNKLKIYAKPPLIFSLKYNYFELQKKELYELRINR
jgi:hypothetical protein